MIRNIFISLGLYIICIIFIVLYSVSLYFIGHELMEDKATGSLIVDSKKQIRGSRLFSQKTDSNFFFTPRIKDKFDSPCDLALYNDELKLSLLERYKAADNPYDISLLTPSSSLLDPYIMKRDAIKQAIEIAGRRNIKIETLLRLIDLYALNNVEPFFELEIVNTTLLNAALLEYPL